MASIDSDGARRNVGSSRSDLLFLPPGIQTYGPDEGNIR